jgi:hypothetical protein
MRGKEVAVNEERNRLDDLNIEEAVGRTTPPDLTARILGAASQPALEDAPTPISGAHAVPRSVRPQGRRMTAAIPRRNWQGAGIVAAFMLVMAIGLVAFMASKSPSLKQPTSTAGQPKTTTEPAIKPANQSPSREQRDEPPKSNQSPEPQPEPEPDDSVEQPQQQPDDPIEQHKPEPKPDDTVEQPKPEPTPDDTVEQPKPEPKPDDTVEGPQPEDKTEAKPEKPLTVIASIPATGWKSDRQYQVRYSQDGKWEIPSAAQGEDSIQLRERTDLKAEKAVVTLANGALMYVDGTIGFNLVLNRLNVELIRDETYIDNVGTGSAIMVSHSGACVEIGQGAGLFETGKGDLSIFCVDGQFVVDGKTVDPGFRISAGVRRTSDVKKASDRDWDNPLLTGAPARHLGIEEFEFAPAGKMITGRLESRTATELGTERGGHVAVDTGREAAVGFGFDDEHETLRGEMVRVRYRAIGAEKLVLQLFCPARNDNFGIDLTPGEAGEWHILEIKLSDLRDRETHLDAPAPGSGLSSFTLALDGKSNAQLEVDWVELVREARFGE